MINAYTNLSTGSKRLIWVGYIVYLLWIVILDGWDTLIDAYIRPITHNDFVDVGIMLILYWVVIMLTLWVADGFDS